MVGPAPRPPFAAPANRRPVAKRIGNLAALVFEVLRLLTNQLRMKAAAVGLRLAAACSVVCPSSLAAFLTFWAE